MARRLPKATGAWTIHTAHQLAIARYISVKPFVLMACGSLGSRSSKSSSGTALEICAFRQPREQHPYHGVDNETLRSNRQCLKQQLSNCFELSRNSPSDQLPISAPKITSQKEAVWAS